MFLCFCFIFFRKKQGECLQGPISPSSLNGIFMLYQGGTSSFCLISFPLWYLHWCEIVWTLSSLKCGEGNVGIEVEMSIAYYVLWWLYFFHYLELYLSLSYLAIFRPIFSYFLLKSGDCTKAITFSIYLWFIGKYWLIKMPYSPLLWLLYLVEIN